MKSNGFSDVYGIAIAIRLYHFPVNDEKVVVGGYQIFCIQKSVMSLCNQSTDTIPPTSFCVISDGSVIVPPDGVDFSDPPGIKVGSRKRFHVVQFHGLPITRVDPEIVLLFLGYTCEIDNKIIPGVQLVTDSTDVGLIISKTYTLKTNNNNVEI